MEVSLPASDKPIPEGVEEAELYDGPVVVPHPRVTTQREVARAQAAAMIAPIPTESAPAPSQVSYQPMVKSDYPAAVMVALDVLSARLLGLVALVTACLIWAFVIYDPNYLRIMAAGAFSTSVFLPIMIIYWKAGMTGEGGSNA